MKNLNFKKHMSRRNRKKLIRERNLAKNFRNSGFILVLVPAIIVVQGKLGFGKSLKDGDFIIKSKTIFEALTLDTGAYFSPPFDDMGLFSTLIIALEKAIQNSQLKALGSGAAKKTAKTDLFNCLKSALEYINKLARNTPGSAEQIITAAKMVVRGTSSSKKQEMSVSMGASTCEALLQCIAVKLDGKYYKATYNWQSSVDAGKTWVDLDDTQEAKLQVAGLILGTVMKFRKRSNSKKCGLTPWCAPVDYTVK